MMRMRLSMAWEGEAPLNPELCSAVNGATGHRVLPASFQLIILFKEQEQNQHLAHSIHPHQGLGVKTAEGSGTVRS